VNSLVSFFNITSVVVVISFLTVNHCLSLAAYWT